MINRTNHSIAIRWSLRAITRPDQCNHASTPPLMYQVTAEPEEVFAFELLPLISYTGVSLLISFQCCNQSKIMHCIESDLVLRYKF